MSLKKMALVAALGLSMASAPVMAQTASVERTSAAMAQASAQDDGDFNGTTTYIIAFFVIIVIGLGIYFAIDKDDEGSVSP
jgi:type IV secretory pathway VirB2 component (pilin)